MSTKKTLRLRLSVLKEFGINPCDPLEMLHFLDSLILPEFAADNNVNLENFLKYTRGQKDDVFLKYPLLDGTLEAAAVLVDGLVNTTTNTYYSGLKIEVIPVGIEMMKWLWRPVIEPKTGTRIGTAYVEFSLANNILVKVNDDIAFIQRKCTKDRLRLSLDNLQFSEGRPRITRNNVIEGQMDLFTFEIQASEENYYIIEIAA